VRFSRWHVALITLLAAAGAGAIIAYAAAPGLSIVGTAKFPIDVKAGDYDLIAQVIDLPSGGTLPKHTHGGPTVVYVITGTLTLTDASGTKTVKAGESFTENAGVVHWGSNQGTTSVRVAVSYLIPKGADVITMVK